MDPCASKRGSRPTTARSFWPPYARSRTRPRGPTTEDPMRGTLPRKRRPTPSRRRRAPARVMPTRSSRSLGPPSRASRRPAQGAIRARWSSMSIARRSRRRKSTPALNSRPGRRWRLRPFGDWAAMPRSYHHRLVHEGGFTAERAGPGSVGFRRPDGRLIPPVTHLRHRGERLEEMHRIRGIPIDHHTCRPLSAGDRLDYGIAVEGLLARALSPVRRL